MNEPTLRRLVPPLGWPPHFRWAIVRTASQPPLIGLNRYTRQVIGIQIRLPEDKSVPRETNTGAPMGYRGLSIMWAKPARWWKR